MEQNIHSNQLVLRNISKHYGQNRALKDVSMIIESGELRCILGPSGCGKSTLLRIIAGLEELESGELMVNDADISNVPPRKRKIGMVFQSYALFPHMNVSENITYGLSVDTKNKQEQQRKVNEMLELIGLPEYGGRQIHELSGGEQQRVALGRTLITNPSILLLDEPFSNLDARLRENMREQFRSLQKKLGITTVLVTHDQEEAMAIADSITLMRKGQVEQTGSAEVLYRQPVSSFVASFIGKINLMKLDDYVNVFGSSEDLVSNAKYIGIRPESLELSMNDQKGVTAVVTKAAFHGTLIYYTLILSSEATFRFELMAAYPAQEQVFSLGSKVAVTINESQICHFTK